MNRFDFSDLKVANPYKMICYCKQVTQKEIEIAIAGGAKTLSDIRQKTGACTGNQCKELNPSGKCCSDDINQIIRNWNAELIRSNNQI
ncbi:MAG: (2Fe-2S)-binding protein [Bacteroidota bacterium]|nr:(2Fe-2S)-binding protein [Bacteroidota bacterium]